MTSGEDEKHITPNFPKGVGKIFISVKRDRTVESICNQLCKLRTEITE